MNNSEDKKEHVKPQKQQSSFFPGSPNNEKDDINHRGGEKIEETFTRSKQTQENLSDDDIRKYRDLQFLMVVNLGSSQQSL